MKTNLLGTTGISVTPVGMGVLTVGKTQLDLPVEEGAELIRYAMERGINFFDTAEYYETYPYLRAALKGGAHEPVIASKSLALTYEDMEKAIDDMRRALDLDVIDIFLLHELRAGGDFARRAGAWECLNTAKAMGIVRAIGISTHHVDVASRNARMPESDLLFALINRSGLGIRKGEGFGTKEEMALAILENYKQNKGVFAMKVFGGGNLTGRYLPALDYVSALLGIDSMMVGIGAKHEIDRLVEYAEGTIDQNYVPDIRHKKIHIDQGDCEGCGACVARCPNKAISLGKTGLADVNHEICLTCGYCAPVCPTRAIIMY